MSAISDLTALNHEIPLSQAIEMTTRYRDNRELILKEEFKNTGILPTCETFNLSAFQTLMAQPGCVALRLYLGMNEQKDIKFLILGVNDQNEDMIPSVPGESLTGGGSVMDEGVRCPPTCPPPSPVNPPPK